MVTTGLPPRRWRWVPAALLVPPLLTLGLPEALPAGLRHPAAAQTTGASDPALVAAGDIAMCNDTGDEGTATLIDSLPGTVLPLGDLAYQDGSKSDFDNCYGPTWGRFKNRSRPATGNHEYVQKGAAPYFDYWGDAAGDRTKGYYSFDIGSWHLIALNSTCAAAGGCSRGTPMEQWLKSDLAATRAPCILAYWHHPRFFTPSRAPGIAHIDTQDRKMSSMWADLQAAGADVVLSGHRHVYERFPRQDSSGRLDPTGVRQFIVGTGGALHETFKGKPAPHSQVCKDQTFGGLTLTLHPGGYDWRFIPTAGGFTDSGSDTCG